MKERQKVESILQTAEERKSYKMWQITGRLKAEIKLGQKKVLSEFEKSRMTLNA